VIELKNIRALLKTPT